MKKLSAILIIGIPSIVLGLIIGGYRGYQHGRFVTALEENKMAAGIVSSDDPNLDPLWKEYMKGRIYYNIATKFPNDRGYLLRKDWDFGPVNKDVTKGKQVGAKDPTVMNGSFYEATQHLSKAERDSEGGIELAKGLSESEIKRRWGKPLNPLDRSFDLLVSKNLHPYSPPETNKLLRWGDSYIVLEFKEERCIAVHHVSG